jgi:CRP-like cAMP-binding protein
MCIGDWRQQVCAVIRMTGAIHAYPRRSLIFQQGMKSDTVYAIETGLVEISGVNREGREVTTSIRGPGEHFGWAEGLLGETRRRQATAIQEAQIWQTSTSAFLEALAADPKSMMSALASAVYRETRFAGMRYDLSGTSAGIRLSYILRHLAKAVQVETSDPQPCVRVTHEELGRICELSRQTVTTILGDMQRNGIVTLSNRSIQVIDTEWLDREQEEQ